MTWLLENIGTAFDLLLVIFGFGLIIFLHELGHFLAARWAGIRVLAFAIGLGPTLFSFRKGLGFRRGSSEPAYIKLLNARAAGAVSPTEYRLAILPFGGFVKMLGQDDANPSFVSDAPDSYQLCPPWKRMIVISAGVTANLITAALLFVIVFTIGLRVEPPVIGAVAPGLPAARAAVFEAGRPIEPGLRPGDALLTINGEKPERFETLILATAMAARGKELHLAFTRDGRTLTARIAPEVGGPLNLYEIGVEPPRSPRLFDAPTQAARDTFATQMATIGLAGVEPDMKLVRAGDNPAIVRAQDLQVVLDRSGGKPVEVEFEDAAGKRASGALTPEPAFQIGLVARDKKTVSPIEHLLGLTPVMKVENDSPPGRGPKAADQGFRTGDVFARIGAVEFPNLAQGVNEIRRHKGDTLAVVVLRPGADRALTEITLPNVRVTSDGRVGFLVGTTVDNAVLVSAPSALLTKAGAPDTVPAKSLITVPGTRITAVNGRDVSDFAELRAALTAATTPDAPATVEVSLRRPADGLPGEGPAETVRWELSAADTAALHALGWSSPLPMAYFRPEEIILKGDNPVQALRKGMNETKRVMISTYLTFVRLAEGTVKIEHLKGPVGIAHLGTLVAGKGFIWMLFFLGLISVNLAVVNFLPLPFVDGGQFLFLVYEQVRGRPAPLAIYNAVNFAGILFIVGMFLVVTFNDIRNLFGI